MAAVAILGLVVACVSLGWQIVQWWMDRRTVVELETAVIASAGADVLYPPPIFMAMLTNKSRHEIHVKSAELKSAVSDQTQLAAFCTLPRSEPSFPVTIPARDRTSVFFNIDLLANGFELNKPFHLVVTLGDGRTVKSKLAAGIPTGQPLSVIDSASTPETTKAPTESELK